MIKAIAIDDEPLAIDLIKTFCSQGNIVQLLATFTEASQAVKFLQENTVDLVLLDINMPAISGIDFHKRFSSSSMVIFTTAYSEFAAEGFALNAIDYLLKPFSYERFQRAAEKANDYHSYRSNKEQAKARHLFLKVDYSLHKMAMSDIAYIEGIDNYIKIFTRDGKSLRVRMTLKAIMEKLDPQQFVRVHKSFIVSVSKVTAAGNKELIVNDMQIPIGPNYTAEVTGLFHNSAHQ